MSRNYHVVPSGSGWIVRLEDAQQASSRHIKKEKAVQKAKDLAERKNVLVKIHNKSGMIARTVGKSFV